MTVQDELAPVKEDFFAILDKAPWEAYAVRQAVIKGQIYGKTYFGECCCIKGIIAKDLGMPLGEAFFSEESMVTFTRVYDIPLSASKSPLEQYIIDIRPGHTPENNEQCRQLLVWLDEYITGLEVKQAANLEAKVHAGLEEVLATLPAAEEGVVSELVHA